MKEKIKNIQIDRLNENTYFLIWSENNNNSMYNDLVEVLINLEDGSASFTRFGVTGYIIDKYDGNFSHVYSDKNCKIKLIKLRDDKLKELGI